MRLRQDTQHQIGTKRESARTALLHHFAFNTHRDLAIDLDLAHVKTDLRRSGRGTRDVA